MMRAIVVRIVLCTAVALVATSAPAIALLRGHGIWFVVAGFVTMVVSGLLSRRIRLPREWTRVVYSAGAATLGLYFLYDSTFATGVTYIVRVLVIAITLAALSALGTNFASVVESEERLRTR